MSGGSNITAALKDYFPQLTQTDLEEYLQEYPLSDFDSVSQQFQIATGESDVICGVSDTFLPFTLLPVRSRPPPHSGRSSA